MGQPEDCQIASEATLKNMGNHGSFESTKKDIQKNEAQ